MYGNDAPAFQAANRHAEIMNAAAGIGLPTGRKEEPEISALLTHLEQIFGHCQSGLGRLNQAHARLTNPLPEKAGCDTEPSPVPTVQGRLQRLEHYFSGLGNELHNLADRFDGAI